MPASPDNGVRFTEYPHASRLIVHISDTHLLGDDSLLYGEVDSTGHFTEALAELEGTGARPDAIVFTGDLADVGEAGAYRKLRELVEPAAQRMGGDVVWLMGNHDRRSIFRVELLDETPSTDPIDRVYDFHGLRLIALDSTVPGQHHGEITEAQLDWLAGVLADPAPLGTILALHHPPIPCVQDLATTVELRDQQRLAAVLRGSDIRAILAGHLHQSSFGSFAGIPVSVASATCYTQDLTVPVGGMRPRDGAQAFNFVHIYEETIVHTVVPVGRGPEMSFTDADHVAAELARIGLVVPDAAE